MIKPMCIYHDPCTDGFAAAWVVNSVFGSNCEYVPGVYGEKCPVIRPGQDVVLVDFSYKRPIMEAIIAIAGKVIVLDHHKTAQAELEGLDGIRSGVEIHFDMTKSGAVMAWEFFRPNELVPTALKYVQDRDLWTKKLEGVDEFTFALMSYPKDFSVWTDLIERGPATLIDEGRHIKRYYLSRVNEMLTTAYQARLMGHTIWVCNSPNFAASEVAGALAERGPFGVSYCEVKAGHYQYSLRSRGVDGLDVSLIARTLGGGGHKNASGFMSDHRAHHPVHF